MVCDILKLNKHLSEVNHMEDNYQKYVKLVRELHKSEEVCNLQIMNEYEPLLKYELTTRQELILKLVSEEHKVTMSEIAEKMCISNSAISQMISKLESRKFVERVINLQNRREVFVILGQAAKEYFNYRDKIEDNIIKKYYTTLSIEEIESLLRITKKLEQSIEKQKGEQD